MSADAYGYAERCYEYLGLKAYSYKDISFILDIENSCIKEFLTERSDYTSALSELQKVLPKGVYTVYSYKGKDNEPFGMVWFTDNDISLNEIYMNIALD